MNDQQFQEMLHVLDQLKAVELAVARLYSEFAIAFPEDHVLWEGLRDDEEGHAHRVDELKKLVAANREEFIPDKFNTAVLNTYLTGLNDNVRRLKNGEIKRHQAAVIAKDFENTLVEGSFYRVARSTLPA